MLVGPRDGKLASQGMLSVIFVEVLHCTGVLVDAQAHRAISGILAVHAVNSGRATTIRGGAPFGAMPQQQVFSVLERIDRGVSGPVPEDATGELIIGIPILHDDDFGEASHSKG